MLVNRAAKPLLRPEWPSVSVAVVGIPVIQHSALMLANGSTAIEGGCSAGLTETCPNAVFTCVMV